MADKTDLIVLGGGTGGYVAAIRAAQAGLDVTIIEKEKLGGVCLHKGCIPTKALLKSAEVYDTMKESELFGVSVEGDLAVNFQRMQERKQGIIDQLHAGVEALCKKNKIKVLHGEGAVLGPSIFSPVSGAVAVTYNDPDKEDEVIVPKNVIIATGSTPRALPNVPFDHEYIVSSDEMLQLEELPQSIVIVGGGVIGVEWASLLNSLGVKVTIVEYADRLVINESKGVSRELEKQFKKKGIDIKTGQGVEAVEVRDGQAIVTTSKEETLTADKVMVAIGRTPTVNNLGLQNTSVKYDEKGIQVNDYYQTTEGHIYAIGDCIPTLQLAHVAMKEAEIAVAHMTKQPHVETIDYVNVPRCTYTSPEIASVGYTRDNLPEGVKAKFGTYNFENNGKALVTGKATGFIEVIRDELTDDLLGVTMIGPHATDMLSEASTAKYLDATPMEIGEAIHAHPTLSEVLQEAALDTYQRAIHK